MLNSKDIIRKVVGPASMFTASVIGVAACGGQDNHANRAKQRTIETVFKDAVNSGECKVDSDATEVSIQLPDKKVVVRSTVIGGDADFVLYGVPQKKSGASPALAYLSDDYSRFVDDKGLVSTDKDGNGIRQEGVKDVAASATEEIINELTACTPKVD